MDTSAGSGLRLVVCRLRYLGDVVLSTPALDALRERLPEARIEYLTYAPYAPVLQGHPAVDRVIVMPPKPGVAATLRAVRDLRRPRTDWVFDLLGNPRTAALVGFASPRNAVGFDRGGRSRVYQHRLPWSDGSQLAQHLAMVAPLVGPVEPRAPRVHVGEDERRAARIGLELEGGEIFVHPGATYPWRLWPLERWPALVGELRRQAPGAGVRVVSQRGDEAQVERLVAACGGRPDVRALPPLELRPFMAALSHGGLYVGNDGGAMHLAVALGVPTVGILGGENPTETWFSYASLGPHRPVRRAGASPLRDHRGTLIGPPDASVEEVAEAAREAREAAAAMPSPSEPGRGPP